MARVLDLLIVAGTAVLSVRLLMAGLHRRYRAFFLYLIFETVRGAVVASVNQHSDLYQKIWVLTEPLEWLFYVLVLLEIYSLVLADYRGLATAGRWILLAAVAVALLASGLTLLAPSTVTGQGPLLRYYYVAERAVYFSLAVFLLTILGFLTQYPITLTRNIIVHSMIFTGYFLGNTALYSLLSMHIFGEQFLQVIAYPLDLVTIASLCAWLVMLNPTGEHRTASVRRSFTPKREQELVSQLNSLNAALLRVARK